MKQLLIGIIILFSCCVTYTIDAQEKSPIQLSGSLMVSVSGQTTIDRHLWLKAEYIYLRNYEGTMIQETYNVEDRISYKNNSDAVTSDFIAEIGAIFFDTVQMGVGYQHGNPISFNKEAGQLSMSSAFVGISIGDLKDKKTFVFTRIGAPTIHATSSFVGSFELRNDASYWSVGVGHKVKSIIIELGYSCWSSTMDYSRQYQIANASTLEYLTETKEVYFSVSKISLAFGVGF